MPFQTLIPLFTELRTHRNNLRMHVGVSEFLLPVTPGQAGTSPAKSDIEFGFRHESVLFYCAFLRRLSGNRAHYEGLEGRNRAGEKCHVPIWNRNADNVVLLSLSVIPPQILQNLGRWHLLIVTLNPSK